MTEHVIPTWLFPYLTNGSQQDLESVKALSESRAMAVHRQYGIAISSYMDYTVGRIDVAVHYLLPVQAKKVRKR